MAKLEPTDGFGLHGWMVTELHLGGYELMAYALVHQFSQKGKAGLYTGGVPYLSSWLQCSDMTARKYLHSLEEKGLIVAKDGNNEGVPYRYYKVIDNQIPKIFGGTPKNFGGNTQKNMGSTPKNFGDNNNIDIKSILIPPTPQEIAGYARSRGFVDPEGFANNFVAYYSEGEKPWHLSNGKPMKDWKRAVITWESNNKDRYFSHQSRQASTQPSRKMKSFNLDDLK